MASDQLTPTVPFSGVATPRVPPLEPGDHLSRSEFERRYRAMPEVKKAELVEGVVYMPSPARLKCHAGPHADILGWLYAYKAGTEGVESADNATVRLDLDNEPQPDAILYIEPECGGQIRINEDDYVEQAPELIVEIASSSASYDLGPKLRAYRRNGVCEYVVWRVRDEATDWFVLRDSEYHCLEVGDDRLLRSRTFPGLWLDAEAMLAGNHAAVLQAVQKGLNSPEHAEFVKRLATARTG